MIKGDTPAQRRLRDNFDQFLKLIENGSTIEESIAAIPEFPSKPTFHAAMKSDADLAARYRAANRKREKSNRARGSGLRYSRQEVIDALRGSSTAGPSRSLIWKRTKGDKELQGFVALSRTEPGHVLKSKLYLNEMFVAAMHAVPRGYDEWLREDIASDIMVAVLSKELSLDEIKKSASDIVARKAKPYLRMRHLESLDAPLFDEGRSVNRLDSLAAQSWYE